MQTLETRISGIPCQVLIETCNIVKGSYNYNAASDWDYYGYREIEFTVLDRKGYEARWLEKKLTAEDISRIEDEIVSYMKEDV